MMSTANFQSGLTGLNSSWNLKHNQRGVRLSDFISEKSRWKELTSASSASRTKVSRRKIQINNCQ